MRRIDENPLDPEICAQLDAIDATLAGEPVDPKHAELAELALLLAAETPSIESDFARRLDQRVARRFAPAAGAAGGAGGTARGGGAGNPGGGARPHRWRGSWLGPLAGLSTAAVAAAVVVVFVTSTGGGSSPNVVPYLSTTAGTGSTAAGSAGTSSTAASSPGTSTSAASSAGAAASSSRTFTPAARQPHSPKGSSPSAGSLSPSVKSPVVNGGVIFGPAQTIAGTPQPVPNGRKVIQSAQLALTAGPDHIEAVAQELFDVVGRENGYVQNSTVTAGSGGYAQFELSVPSTALQATMTALSQLHYSTVASRTDATQDVNGQYLSDQRKLGDDRALRTSLLKQLASATTQQQIDSLKAQIRDAEASIRSDEATLRGLGHQIDYSQISVTINGAPTPVSHHHSSGSFTIGKAAHDAGRVLTVAAGVALITLAAMVPALLVGSLGWWIAIAVRRRRREQALDLA